MFSGSVKAGGSLLYNADDLFWGATLREHDDGGNETGRIAGDLSVELARYRSQPSNLDPGPSRSLPSRLLPEPMEIDRRRSRPRFDGTDDPTRPIRNMHDVFSNRCRRSILYCLQEEVGPVRLSNVLHRVVTRRPAGGDPADPGAGERLTPEAARQQVFKLEEFGLVEYDPETDAVWIPDDVAITVTPPE